MVITEIQPNDVLTQCRKTLGLPETNQISIEDELLAALLRRCAGYLCPCSPTTLRKALLESLHYLLDNDDNLSDRIDSIIEGITIGGDLLELSDVATDDSAIKGTWLFAAPPSFIIRPSGNIFVTGIVPDQDAFLPPSLASRIGYQGVVRIIAAEANEDLPEKLRENGLQELSADIWLRAPKPESPQGLLAAIERRLDSQIHTGPIQDLQILDPEQRVTYYRGRWVTPKNQSGTFVARRPQDFGTPIWCLVRLTDGVPERLLDLPLQKSRWRACDTAWHVQMAIDHYRKDAQRYRLRHVNDSIRFDFFSPLPQWAERRLILFGQPVPAENCLISYVLPSSEATSEEEFLTERLWLESTDISKSEGAP